MTTLTFEEMKRRVFLDPGHSKNQPGATSRNGLIHEEALNLEQANYISDWLGKIGIEAVVFEPEENLPLLEIKENANQFYSFVSLHHNDSDEPIDGDPYTTVFIHPEHKVSSKELADMVLNAVCEAIGSPSKKVLEERFKVIDMAEKCFDGPCILVESYFITNYTDLEVAKRRSLKAAEAIAQTIATYINNLTSIS
jgi:N-acetylmuramoyl-L-alanine amidase